MKESIQACPSNVFASSKSVFHCYCSYVSSNKKLSLLKAMDYTALKLIHLVNNPPPFGTNDYIYLHYGVARNSIASNMLDVSHLTDNKAHYQPTSFAIDTSGYNNVTRCQCDLPFCQCQCTPRSHRFCPERTDCACHCY